MSGRGVSIYCPYCHRFTSIDPAPVKAKYQYDEFYVSAIWKKSESETWWIGICNNCQNPVLVLNDGKTVHPRPLPSPTDSNIPDEIRSDLIEAKLCFSASAHRGSAVMARRSMQVAAICKGAKSEKLGDQIRELKENGLITLDLKEWADAVRWVGNDAAHPGGSAVTKEDAENVLKLAEQFLHVLYVAPALAADLRKKLRK